MKRSTLHLTLIRAIGLIVVLSGLFFMSPICEAQVAGNVGFAQGQSGAKGRADQSERNRRTLTPQELPPTNSGMFVEAAVLMNVKADQYVAVFGLAQEGASVEEASARMDAVVRQFTDAVKELGVPDGDIYVDYIVQPKIYAYEFSGDVAREKLAGFELKKNISVRYRDHAMLDRLLVAAGRAKIYDLIKVDYIVDDAAAVQAKLMVEAAAVIKEKIARYETLLGIKTQGPAQVYAERSGIHYPSTMYDSYVAAESESIGTRPAQRYTVEQARKGKTFFFNGLDGDGFDRVVSPVIVEPVVQFALYLKVKYEVVRW